MFIFLTVTLFFQFKYGLFTSREMRVILNERAPEPAFLPQVNVHAQSFFSPVGGEPLPESCRFLVHR